MVNRNEDTAAATDTDLQIDRDCDLSLNDPLVENPFLAVHHRATEVEALLEHLVKGNLEEHVDVVDNSSMIGWCWCWCW